MQKTYFTRGEGEGDRMRVDRKEISTLEEANVYKQSV